MFVVVNVVRDSFCLRNLTEDITQSLHDRLPLNLVILEFKSVSVTHESLLGRLTMDLSPRLKCS